VRAKLIVERVSAVAWYLSAPYFSRANALSEAVWTQPARKTGLDF